MQRHCLFPGFFKKPPTPENQQWIKTVIGRTSFQTAANYSIRNRVLAKVSKDYGAVKYLKIVDEELVKKKQNVEIILLLKMDDKYTEADKGQSARTRKFAIEHFFGREFRYETVVHFLVARIPRDFYHREDFKEKDKTVWIASRNEAQLRDPAQELKIRLYFLF